MKFKEYPFSELLSNIVDNRGKTCPIQDVGIPLIATNCIKNESLYPVFEKVRYISSETYNNWFRGHPKQGDLIFVCKGSPGRVAWVPDPVTFCIAQDMVAIRADDSKIDPKYLFALLRSKAVQDKIVNMHVGTLIPHFKKGDFKNLHLSIHTDIEYQKKIGVIYFDISKKIESNTKANQTLEQIAQAIFKSWFVDFDPVKAKIAVLEAGGTQEAAELATMSSISGKNESQLAQLKIQDADVYQQLAQTAALFPAAMQESEVGEIPDEWTALPLYETAEYINGAAFKAEDFSDDRSGLPIVKIAELKQGISDGTKFTTGNFNKRIFIKTDDVLYSWSGSPETSLEVFKWFGGDGWLNQHIFKLNFSSDEQKYFTYYLLKHLKPVLIETAKQKQTTGLGHITVADMKRIKIITPDKAIFLEFAKKVKSLYDHCSLLEKENIALTNIRDSLIPKLLSGEITFSDVEPT